MKWPKLRLPGPTIPPTTPHGTFLTQIHSFPSPCRPLTQVQSFRGQVESFVILAEMLATTEADEIPSTSTVSSTVQPPKKKHRCTRSCCIPRDRPWHGLILGAILLLAGIFVKQGEVAEWSSIIPSLLMLKPSSATGRDGFVLKFWKNPTQNIPLLQTFYFFNITNPVEVMEQGAKPYVETVGPFIYRERRPKFDVRLSR